MTDDTLAQIDQTVAAEGQVTVDFPEFRTIERAEYRIDSELARGGMGRILNARDRRHGRPVAIKELLGSNPALQARFRRETLITARLQHPSIVPLYEAGRWPGGEPFYTMKKVVGRPLDKVIAEKSTVQQRLSLLPHVIAVADALAYAHDQRIIHRDLKPANILVGDFGETVVIDWGLAKDLEGGSSETKYCEAENTPRPSTAHERESLDVVRRGNCDSAPRSSNERLTVAGQAMGTPSYMPPEQARGEPVDERADVYALGALLYHLLGGFPPYADLFPKRASVEDVLDCVTRMSPTPLENERNFVHQDLLAILDRAMARKQEDRYPNARTLADDLKRFVGGRLVLARSYSKPHVVFRWLGRHFKLPLVASVLTALTIVVVGLFVLRRIISEHSQGQPGQRRPAAECVRGPQELRRARDRLMFAVANSAAETDPTLSIAILREVEAPTDVRGWFNTVMRSASEPLARSVIGGSDDKVLAASFGKEGVRTLSVSSSRVPQVSGAGNWEKPVILRDGILAYETVAAVFSPAGMRLATILKDSTALLWRSDFKGSPVAIHGRGLKKYSWVFDPTGRRIVAVSRKDRSAIVSNTDGSGESSFLVGHGGGLLSAAFNANGTSVVTTSTDRTARVWASHGKGRPVVLRGHVADVLRAAFSPDGKLVVTASADGTARIWRAAGGGKAVILKGHSRPVMSAVFSPDGDRVVTVSKDRTARVWKTDGSERPMVLRGHQGGVVSATFDPSGARIMTLSRLGKLRIWSVLSHSVPYASSADVKRLSDWMWRITDLCLDTSERQELFGDILATGRARYDQCRSRVRSVRARWTGAQLPISGGE